MIQVADKTDALVQLRNEVRDGEEKYRDASSRLGHQLEVNKELKDEMQQAKAKVKTVYSKIFFLFSIQI